MAVPTLTSLTPATGLTRGRNVVFLAGSNFRLPPAVSPGYDPGDAQQTVKVTFGGVDSGEAHAITAIKAMAVVPAWTGDGKTTGPFAVDVRIANLDDAGAEIAGENATKASGYSYSRAPLTSDSAVQRVTREVVKLFRRHVHKNTHISMSADYDDDTASDRIKQAGLPLVRLIGPTETEIPRWGYRIMEEETDGDNLNMWTRPQVPKTVMLDFDVDVWTDSRNTHELFGLGMAIQLMVRDFGFVTVTHPVDGEISYPLEMLAGDHPGHDLSPEFDGLRRLSAGFRVMGVDVDDDNATTVERGFDHYEEEFEFTLETV